MNEKRIGLGLLLFMILLALVFHNANSQENCSGMSFQEIRQNFCEFQDEEEIKIYHEWLYEEWEVEDLDDEKYEQVTD